MFMLIFVSLLFSPSLLGHLNDFASETVSDFLYSARNVSISNECRNSISKVEPFLSHHYTIPQQKEFFFSSYTKGESKLFTNRDQDRWVFRAFKCIQSAGEESYLKSENPMQYCLGFNEEKEKSDGTAYGICIPSTCKEDKVKLLQAWGSLIRNDSQAIDYVLCANSRHDKQWYEQAFPLTEFIIHQLFMFIVVAATVYHLRKGEQTKSRWLIILLAFSAKKNISRLIQLPKDPKSTITCMFGMRFISMVWTLIGHSFIFVQAYLQNVDEFKNDMVDNFYNQWITNFTLSVDTFFVLSATLTSFTWFKKVTKNPETCPSWNSWHYWLIYYRHRLIRLWPAYIYVLVDVGMRASRQHFHPMWPPTDPAVQCPKYWWQNVLFVNSLLNNRCMPWTWYIGTEFIFYLLSPIFLLSLKQTPIIGIVLSVSTIMASNALRIIAMLHWNFPPTQFLWKQPDLFNTDFIQHHIVLYIKPQYRIGPYIIGLLLGYYLVTFYNAAIKKKTIKFQIIGWTLAFLAGFWAIFGLYPSLQGWNWPIYHLFYGGFHRSIFALSMAWLIFACYTGIGGIVNRILSMSFLIPLASLSYGAYLMHMVLVVFTYLLVPFPIIYNGKLMIFAHCAVQLLLSYLFGAITALIAELPAQNLEQILFYNKKIRRDTSDNDMIRSKETEAKIKLSVLG